MCRTSSCNIDCVDNVLENSSLLRETWEACYTQSDDELQKGALHYLGNTDRIKYRDENRRQFRTKRSKNPQVDFFEFKVSLSNTVQVFTKQASMIHIETDYQWKIVEKIQSRLASQLWATQGE